MDTLPISTVPPPSSPPSPPPESGPRPDPALDCSRIAQDLQIRKVQVESVIQLLNDGNTVPFITRYRKERTGGLNEDVIRIIQARVAQMRHLFERRQTVLRSIECQGKLNDELRKAILGADTAKRLEDLYLPFKPKKRSLATIARERGLEPLAEAIWNRDPVVAALPEVLAGMVNPEKELAKVEDVLDGVHHLLAERCAETAEVRAAVRRVLWESGIICTARNESLPPDKGHEYKDYAKFSEPLRRIPPHRILAINRGEKENALKVRLEWNEALVGTVARDKLPLDGHPHRDLLEKALEDALKRLLLPSLEREIRRELTDEAEDHAVRVFARNLKSLLLQPPLRGRRVLAVDPGFRTGCKIAVLDEHGRLLDHGVIYLIGKGDRGRGKPKAPKPAEGAVPSPSPTAKAEPAPAAIDAAAVAEPALASPPAESMATPVSEDAAHHIAPVIAQESVAAEEPAIPPVQGFVVSSIVVAAGLDLGAVPAPATIVAAAPPAEGPAPGHDPAAAARLVREEAKTRIVDWVRKHHLNVIAIGNGTACRETEELVAEAIAEHLPDLAYVIVNEAGASEYSTSPVAREEFPDFDATLRGTVSIGRRLQDPLSELVKIDPPNIGVGLYQQDILPRRLRDSLDAIVESCVNHVGVDVNTASVPLLRHVSGLNQLAARELVDYRQQHGPFKNRQQLMEVPGVGPARFVQAAGFLRVPGASNPLDETWVHPESYESATKLLTEMGMAPEMLRSKDQIEELRKQLGALDKQAACTRLSIGMPTFEDICQALVKPGRDPREDLPPPIFKKGILKLDNLLQGMELKGTVLNVVDFGAFVDIGLKDSGLVHISQIANRYIKNPYDIVAVGDVVTVWVLAVDKERQRVSLTMIKPGTERRPPEKGAEGAQQPQGRPEQPRRPPPGRRPPPQRSQSGSPTSAPPRRREAQPPPPPPPPPRKPKRALPKPNLSKAALEGEAPLRTFSELKAFFEAQNQPPPPVQQAIPPQPAPQQEPAAPTPVPPPAAETAPPPAPETPPT